jgi:hypothetical protein
MNNKNKHSSKDMSYQIQKLFIITIAIEVLIDRTFYRLGVIFFKANIYNSINTIGAVARIMMVLLNFIYLGLFLYKGRLKMSLKLIISFELFFFLTSYLFYSLKLDLPVIFQFTGFLVGTLIINFLLIKKVKLNEFDVENRRVSIISNLILISIIIIVNFALIHEMLFTLNAIYDIPSQFHLSMFDLAQVFSVVILCPLIFVFPLMFKDKIKLDGILRKVPLIVILIGVIIILGFVNSGLTVTTEEHEFRAPQMFAWTLIYVLGFTYLASSMILLNWSIISLGLLLTGIYLIWILGKSKKNQSLKQYSYGLFFLLCSAFMFVEATDLFFFMETFNAFLILNFISSLGIEKEKKINYEVISNIIA